MKALGVGLWPFRLHDVEVVRDGLGAPEPGAPGRRPPTWPGPPGRDPWHLSLTHTDTVALAVVVADGGRAARPPGARGPKRAAGPDRRPRCRRWTPRGRHHAARRPGGAGRDRGGAGRPRPAGRGLRAPGGGGLRQGQQRGRRPGGGPAAGPPGCPGPGGGPRRGRRPSGRPVRRSTWWSTRPSAPDSAAPTTRPRWLPASPVLAVDIPSGVAGDTGAAAGPGPVRRPHRHLRGRQARACCRATAPAWPARWRWSTSACRWGTTGSTWWRTATWPPGCPRGPRPATSGRRPWPWWPDRPGMTGAAGAVARAAYRAGAGMVRLGVPGGDPADLPATEAVGVALPGRGGRPTRWPPPTGAGPWWSGPGSGGPTGTGDEVRRLLAGSPVPTVVDADGLHACSAGSTAGRRRPGRRWCSRPTTASTGGWWGRPPGPTGWPPPGGWRRQPGAVVLLKGPTTAVADPSGRVLLVRRGRPHWPRPAPATSCPG